MSPFDRAHDVLWLYLVSTEIFNVAKYRILEIQVKGQSRSLKVVLFDRLGIVFLYQCSIVTLSLRDIRLVSL